MMSSILVLQLEVHGNAFKFRLVQLPFLGRAGAPERIACQRKVLFVTNQRRDLHLQYTVTERVSIPYIKKTRGPDQQRTRTD